MPLKISNYSCCMLILFFFFVMFVHTSDYATMFWANGKSFLAHIRSFFVVIVLLGRVAFTMLYFVR